MISLVRKHARLILIAIAAVFLILNLKIQQADASTKKYYSINEKKKILIDPGHGGIDGGAESKSGTVEKDINLSIALKLKKILTKNGFDVVMTREEDNGLYTEKGTIRKKKYEDLENRCKIKKESECEMFVSIHLNMFPQSKYYGAQVWYSNSEKSGKLAHIIQENLKEDLDENNKRIEKPALEKYKILRCCEDIPSVIVECGFISNYEEEQKLKSEIYQEKIAESLGKSIAKYYTE